MFDDVVVEMFGGDFIDFFKSGVTSTVLLLRALDCDGKNGGFPFVSI